jgi:hypothetical protein
MRLNLTACKSWSEGEEGGEDDMEDSAWAMGTLENAALP